MKGIIKAISVFYNYFCRVNTGIDEQSVSANLK